MIKLTLEEALKIKKIAEKFIAKVDKKQARSVETYEDMKWINRTIEKKLTEEMREMYKKGVS